MMVERASVVGLGKLGACMAAAVATADIDVVGVDIDAEKVASLDDGQAPVDEPQLQSFIEDSSGEISATDSIDAVADTDVTFVVVNTPLTSDHRYSLDQVESVCKPVGEAIAEKDDYHLVVVTSTVFPGSTTGPVQEWLEAASGKTTGEDFGLVYSPEFIAIGNVMEGLLAPDFFLVGEHDERAGDVVESIYDDISHNDAPVVRMDPTSAEVTKMAVNSYITMKISYANTLAQISDGVGADVDEIVGALTEDGRIDGSYLTPGAIFGGPCFPRDNRAFAKLAEDADTEAPLARATDAVNDGHTEYLADAVREHTGDGETVAILGLTYKPGTYLTEQSQGLELVRALGDEFEMVGYDPEGVADAATRLQADLTLRSDLEEVLADADTAVLTVRWDELTDPASYDGQELTLLDPWRCLGEVPDLDTVRYLPFGRGSKTSTAKMPMNHQ